MENKDNKKKKRRNGIWFNNTASIDLYAQEKAERLQKILENVIFYGITIPIQLFQTFGVVLIAIYNNAFAELSFFLIGFFFTRTFLGETFHLSSTVLCTTFTWILFFLITSFIPGLYLSVFLCIVLGCMVAIYMNYIVTKGDDNSAQEVR